MSWITHRNVVMTISALGAAVALGLSKAVGITMNTGLLGTSITPQIVFGIGFIYIFGVLYTKYL